MTRLFKQTKKLVATYDWGGDDSNHCRSFRPIFEENWSNFLEAALKGELKTMQALLLIMNAVDIIENLAVLSRAILTCKKYEKEQKIEVGWFNGECYETMKSAIEIKALKDAKILILTQLNPNFNYESIGLSFAEKREIEKRILTRIQEQSHLNSLIALYDIYTDSALLNSQRYSSVRFSFLNGFYNHYSSVKINLLSVMQTKALDLITQASGLSSKEKVKLSNTIFSPLHRQHGLKNEKIYHAFDNIIAAGCSTEIIYEL